MINTDSNQLIVIDPAKQRWIIQAKSLSGFSPESIISGLHFVTILAAVLYGFALLFSLLTPGKQIAKIHCDQ